MAYSSATISATDLALMALDKPILAGVTSIGNLSAGRFVASPTGVFADAAIDSTTRPFTNAVDGLAHVQASITAADASIAMLFDFYAPGIEFDFIAFQNHDLYSKGCTDLDIQIADSSDFATNLVTIVNSYNPSASLTGDYRFTQMTLSHSGGARRYSNVRYVRIGMTFSGAVIPNIGEVLFCRRRQMTRNPDDPGYDPNGYRGNVERLETQSGIKRDVVYHKGARHLGYHFQAITAAERSDVLGWFTDCGYGTRSFVFIDQPTTAPNSYMLAVLDEPAKLDFPYTDWSVRDWTLEATEQGPHFVAVNPV